MSSCQKSKFLLAILAALPLSHASGGNPAPEQIDVSIEVAVTPSVFRPGDLGTVALTLHNDGPAPAGTTAPGSFGNYVIGPAFALGDSAQWGPFDIVWDSVQGCVATYDVVGPGPDLTFALMFQFYFAVIPPDTSLTCTFEVLFLPAPFESFVTKWSYIPRIFQNDVEPGNNDTYYTFVAGPPYAAPVPAPAMSWPGKIFLILSIGLIALLHRSGRSGRV